jgi:hypothetical protein
MNPQLPLVNLQKNLTGLTHGIRGIRLESKNPNFEALASAAKGVRIQFNSHVAPHTLLVFLLLLQIRG